MNQFANLLGIFVVLLLGIAYIWIKARTTEKMAPAVETYEETYSINTLIAYVKKQLHELSRAQINDWGMSEEAWNRKLKSRSELRKALRGCTWGDRNDKRYVKSYIKDLLLKGCGLNERTIDNYIPFHQRDLLTAQDRFEIVLYLFSLRYGDEALSMLIDTYRLDLPKESNFDHAAIYDITGEDIEEVFFLEYRELDFREKLDILVQRVYQQYKGFSVVDEIREQRIDGFSGGVNGITVIEDNWQPLSSIQSLEGWSEEGLEDEDGCVKARVWDSVWIFYKGKSIRLSFLTFGCETELKRVCQNIYKYNLPGQLSEANGYKVNEMKDGSRVVVVRPPFAETWAFFVRKFDMRSAALEQLIEGDNAELPIQLLKFLMKGSRITSITGSQGSGKTTLLMALVKHIYPSYTLRVQEMSFELNLRKLYSTRNILTFRETEYISGQAGLDLQKKTDGTVNILGEVASDDVAAWMIQMAQVASMFTLFTHHAKTFRDLIESLRNSLLKSGMFRDEHVAEMQVVSVIDFDIHLRKSMSGQRYIEKITECERDERGYRERIVLEYRNGQYSSVEPISDRMRREMAREMTDEDKAVFTHFLGIYWGEEIGA
ncbi:P-loop NTPase family protein [Paenibacillus bouchesdurhonensis]|uniref:ATPase, T2SS/T4P/T4SS family n=1 Tax=Paenibacillus bouchesdurhonensis TaxID=1870990 RepID=UPI001F3ADB1C|nr:ATPase, T2SS/T4P/T4SS family [Paenibacillus bouchesdurhonensis]